MIKIIKFVFIFICLTLSLGATELQKVSLQLQWKHQFEFAGFYIAKEKGYYKDVGLDVDIKEFDNNISLVESVLKSGNAFAIGYPSVVLEKATSSSIVLLSAIFQSSPHVLVSLKSSGIHSIHDFENKRIMIDEHATKSAEFISMLHSQDVSFSQMKIQKPTFDIQSLIDKETDIGSYYSSNELYALDKKGIAYDVWDPKDYGFDFYNDIVFTSQETLKKSPLIVENFRTASLKGWEYAFSHIDETAALIYEKYNTQNKSEAALLYEARVLKVLAYKGVKEIGTIDKNKIQRVGDIYNVLGLIKNKIDLDSFVYTIPKNHYFTSSEKKYLANKKVINMCIDPNWMPLEGLQDGKYIGMSADYFKLIKKILSVDIKVLQTQNWNDSITFAKERKCDIISLVMTTPEREKYLKFTDPYLKIPLVMATKIDTPFVADFGSLNDKQIGITKGYAFLELLRIKYPNLQIVEVENLQEGLSKVTNGSLYGYIGTLASIGYSFQQNFTGELKIAGKFDGTWDLSIGVRNDDPILYDILQRAVQSIDENQKQQIFNNWLSIKYDKEMDYHLIIEIVVSFIAILVLILYFYLRERKLKKDLELNHILLEEIMNNIPNPMFYKDKTGVYRNVNDAFAKGILGLSKDLISGKSLYDLREYIPLSLIKAYEEEDQKFYEENKPNDYETKVRVSDGSLKDFRINKTIFHSDKNELLGYVGIMTDITELKEKERKLEELASVDPLSKLYNRRYFSHAAEHMLSLAKREKFHLSVVMMDIDNFKKINDNFGHKIGDDVIIILSQKLQDLSRTSDIVCRFGGEEFILLLPHTDIDGASIIAEKIRAEIDGIILNVNENQELKFTVSVGVAEVAIEAESNIEAAIKRADDALYEAKSSGKNRVCKS